MAEAPQTIPLAVIVPQVVLTEVPPASTETVEFPVGEVDVTATVPPIPLPVTATVASLAPPPLTVKLPS